MDRDPIVDELRRSAEELRSVAEVTRAKFPDLEPALRAAEDVARQGVDVRPTVAIIGSLPARIRVVDALVGAALLEAASTSSKGGPRITVVRHAAAFDFVAHSRDGRRVVRFSQRVPDRSELFDRRLEQARSDRDRAIGALEQRKKRLSEAREKERLATEAAGQSTVEEPVAATVAHEIAAPAATASRVSQAPPPWWAFWLWIAHLFSSLFGSKPPLALPATSAPDDDRKRSARKRERRRIEHARREEVRAARERVASLERELDGDDAVTRAERAIERLTAERARYAQERLDRFVADLATVGDEVAELTIEYPTVHLPEGITLLDVAVPDGAEGRRRGSEAVRREAHGFAVVDDPERPMPAALVSFVDDVARVSPRLFTVPATADGAAVGERLRSILADAPGTAARSACMQLQACLPALRSARDEAEAAHRKRLATLEGQRLPDPAEFRARQVERVSATIEQGVDDALESADALLRRELGALRARWTGAVAACATRRALLSLTGEVDEGIASGVAQILERTISHAEEELRQVTQSIELLTLDELRAHYPLGRRLDRQLLPPMAIDRSREKQSIGTTAAPLALAAAAFERKRVTIGLGGAAVGAAIGTAILPGIGSAVGAFVGVFVGFLPRSEALRKDCLARVEACVGDVEARALAVLAARRTELARVLHETIDSGLAGAFERHEDTIARLQEVERRAIADARDTLARLEEARTTLARNELRLQRIGEPPQTAKQP